METREKQAEILKFMGTSTRLAILDFLYEKVEGQQPVEICRELKLDSSVVSRELKILKEAGIIGKALKGKELKGVGAYYEIKSKLAKIILELISTNPEIK